MPGYGWRKQRPDHRDYTLVDPHAPARLPAKVSLRDSPHMPPVYDQGHLGSCTANAIAGAYEFELRRQGEDFMPSRLWIYYQERAIEGTVGEDSGAELRDGLRVVGSLGVCPEQAWPYDVETFQGPPPADATAAAEESHAINYFALNPIRPGFPLRASLAAGFPFVFGFPVPAMFEKLTAANPYLPLPGPEPGFVGGHAVMAVGYDFTCEHFPVPVFEIRNSWSTAWGDDGYFWMDLNYFGSLANDIWTIRSVT